MNKRISLGLAISLVAIGCAITLILTWTVSLNSYNSKIASKEKYEGVYQKLQEMDATVRGNYFGTLDNDALETAIINGYVSGIGDKYASYLTADLYNVYQKTNNGVITGVGFEVEEDGSGYLKIAKIYKNGSAESNGVRVGDMITEIGGKSVLSMNGDTARKRISGDVGTTLSLKLVSDGEERTVTLIRQQIDVESVTYKMLENKIGYIKITAFNAKTPEQFSHALNSLNSNGASSFVFDIRHNDGGLMSAVKPMLNRLIPAAAAATAEYVNGTRKTLIETDSEESVTLPIMILTDNKTSSAAEVFAVALRDEQGAQLVGTQTAGKSVLQSTYQFSDGSALILTTAKIIPSKSEIFDGVGLKPDYIVELPTDSPYDTLTQENDTQLQKAIEVLTPGSTSVEEPDNTESGNESAAESSVVSTGEESETSGESSGDDESN